LGFRASGFGLRVPGSGFRVPGSRFQVSGRDEGLDLQTILDRRPAVQRRPRVNRVHLPQLTDSAFRGTNPARSRPRPGTNAARISQPPCGDEGLGALD
jgi:hypothetical protein